MLDKKGHVMSDFQYENVGKNHDILRIVLTGHLKTIDCDYVLQCVESQIDDGCQKLILDCDQVTFISSIGLSMIVRVHARMKKRGGDVKLAAVHGTVANVIHVVRLDKLLEIYPTVQDAIEAHGG